jgi:hypothetical protein
MQHPRRYRRMASSLYFGLDPDAVEADRDEILEAWVETSCLQSVWDSCTQLGEQVARSGWIIDRGLTRDHATASDDPAGTARCFVQLQAPPQREGRQHPGFGCRSGESATPSTYPRRGAADRLSTIIDAEAPAVRACSTGASSVAPSPRAALCLEVLIQRAKPSGCCASVSSAKRRRQ